MKILLITFGLFLLFLGVLIFMKKSLALSNVVICRILSYYIMIGTVIWIRNSLIQYIYILVITSIINIQLLYTMSRFLYVMNPFQSEEKQQKNIHYIVFKNDKKDFVSVLESDETYNTSIKKFPILSLAYIVIGLIYIVYSFYFIV